MTPESSDDKDKRIAELEAELKQRDEFIEVRGRHIIQLADDRDQLQSKLDRAVRALKEISNHRDKSILYAELARQTLAELDTKPKGGADNE